MKCWPVQKKSSDVLQDHIGPEPLAMHHPFGKLGIARHVKVQTREIGYPTAVW